MYRKLQNFLFGTLPNDATKFYNGAGGFTTPTVTQSVRSLIFIIDGAGAVITTGAKAPISVAFNGTIVRWRILSIDDAITSGSIVIDLWKDTYTNYPPTVADTITAAAKPTVSAATKAESTTLTGWNTAVTAGDTFRPNVDSVSTFTRVALEVWIQPS